MHIVSLHRYPVKSMMGEEVNACYITERGVYGDRAFGVIDKATGKLANAKNPKKWPAMFRHRSSYVSPVVADRKIPPVYITLPNGKIIRSDEPQIDDLLSHSFQRNVTLQSPSTEDVQFEGYVPEEMEELDDRGIVFSRTSPAKTFFDLAMLHLISTNTIEALQRITQNSRIEPRRFRPNIVITNEQETGFIEESWLNKVVQIGEKVQLKITRPTKRCVMTTLAQGDLPQDINVLKSIVKNNAGNIGVYAQIIRPGEIKIGDKLTIIE